MRGARGEELVNGELNLTEDITGILFRCAAGSGTFLVGQAVIVDGDQELGVPLQANDGELAQGNV